MADASLWRRWEFPFKCSSKPIAINSHQYIILARDDYASPYKLQKYDTDTNEWSLIMKIDDATLDQTDEWGLAWTIDIKSQIIYIITSDPQPLIINLKTKQMKQIETTLDFQAEGRNLLFIQNKIHMIRRKGYNGEKPQHIIFDLDLSAFNVMHEFDNIDTSLGAFTEYGFVHLKAKQLMFLFGGWIDGSLASDDERKWHQLSLKVGDKDKKWIELESVKFPVKLSHFGFVATLDEQYIIIMGGWINGERISKQIYVFDVEKFMLRECKIECPESGYTACVMMNGIPDNDLLIYGYIRKCYEQDEMKDVNYLSDDLILLISKWISDEEIYVIFGDTHWSVKVSDILNSLL